MPDFEAVIFDLDNTLCFHDQEDHEIHEEVFDRVETEPFFEPADLHALDTDSLPPVDSEVEYYEQVYRALAEKLGVEDKADYARLLAKATVEVIDFTRVSFRDGAEEAVEYASEKYEVGVVTNGAEKAQTTKLETLGIREVFDAEVYCGPGMGLPAKPDPTPLEIALEELDVEPENALKVGDSLELDVAGAHNAGMVSAWVPLNQPTSDPNPEPDYTLGSMWELSELLQE